jgi:phosphoribosylamine--glycine ligase
MTDELIAQTMREIIEPTVRGMKARGTPYQGVLYAGLMLTRDGPKLIEYNARFGDPETQVILPRLAVPLGPLLLAAARGGLRGVAAPATLPVTSVGIVLAARGYPDEPERGDLIAGLGDDGAADDPGALVFHAGTVAAEDGWRTNGGRVLTIVGRGPDVASARAVAEAAADRIAWPGAQRRHDIGATAGATAGAALVAGAVG